MMARISTAFDAIDLKNWDLDTEREICDVLVSCLGSKTAPSVRVRSPLAELGIVHPSFPSSFPIIPREVDRRLRPVLLLEPHSDDVAISVGGSLFRSRRPVTILTIFSESWHVCPALHRHELTDEQISDLRAREGRLYAENFLNGEHLCLRLREASWPWSEPELSRAAGIAAMIRSRVDVGRYEIWGPAGLSLHPDHRIVAEVAYILGAAAYWQDYGANRDYSGSFDERVLLRGVENVLEDWDAVPIDETWVQKLLGMLAFQSQFQAAWQLATVMRRARVASIEAGSRAVLSELLKPPANRAGRRDSFSIPPREPDVDASGQEV